MKLITPEIVWHGKEPVFSADFHRNGAVWRLATGGADQDVKIWKVVKNEESENSKMRILFMASLSRHTKAVNVVRFSPNGTFLASAGDDSAVYIWKLNEVSSGGNLLGEASVSNKENWTVIKMLRGHLEDVYDLCWSSDSNYIITGSVDNTAIVWDVQKGQQLSMLNESKQYVQGVAWDPVGQYVATTGSDKSLRIYLIEQKFRCAHTVNKLSVPDQSGGTKQFRMWMDESLSSFFRRMTFSPDGSLLIVPAGRFEVGDKPKNATYIFTRNNLTKPVLQLPGPEKATVAVRCCPVLFELLPKLTSESESEPPLFNLQYRMVYAVASLDSVLLYDTQHHAPFGFVSNIHYAGITDLTWSNDGLTLVVTSSDGYCTLVCFEPGELGTPLSTDQLPPVVLKQQKENPCKQQQELVTSVSPTSRQPSKSPQAATSAVSEPKVNILKPRRIRPTVIASFSSPEDKLEKMEAKSPTSCVEAKATSTSSSEEKRAAISSPSSCKINENASLKEASDVTINGESHGKTSAPRRVNFVTLSTFTSSPPKHKQESLGARVTPETGQPCLAQEHDQGGSSCKSKQVECDDEPMEVQIIE